MSHCVLCHHIMRAARRVRVRYRSCGPCPWPVVRVGMRGGISSVVRVRALYRQRTAFSASCACAQGWLASYTCHPRAHAALASAMRVCARHASVVRVSARHGQRRARARAAWQLAALAVSCVCARGMGSVVGVRAGMANVMRVRARHWQRHARARGACKRRAHNDGNFFPQQNSLFPHIRFSTLFFSMKMTESGKIVLVNCILDFKDLQL